MVFLLVTLGCRVNQAESGGMGAWLSARGHSLLDASAGDAVTPDAVVVNTCTVTATADKKSRQEIRRLRRRYPDALLCVCGCLSQLGGVAAMPEVDFYAGSGQKSAFIERVETLAARRQAAPPLSPAFPADFDPLPDAPPDGRTRLFCKIQDGCENHCSYCRIPAARGPVRSRAPEDVLCAVRRAAAQGIPEVILSGIEISSYRPALAPLVEAVCRAVPELRVRLGSLHPDTPDEDFCARLRALPNLCPQFHLSLQSGSDEVLRRMGRSYDAAAVRAGVSRLRGAFPGCALSFDILTGFPGETEQQHALTLALVEELRPASLHVFPYSRREGTPAAVLPGQLTAARKQKRAAELIELGARLGAAYRAGFLGRCEPVLFESVKNGLWLGHTVYGTPVAVRSADELRAGTHRVRLDSLTEDGLLGVLA